MSKFVIECPNCGKYAEAHTGFFARKRIDCACGYTIHVRTDKLGARECPHCGNMVVFDQSQGEKAKCPVCHEPINTMAEQNKMEEFSCSQCGVRLRASKAAQTYTCPVCDCVNDVPERVMAEKISKEGMASVIKYEGDADTLVWKHPIEDFNYGSQLIVHESQEAILFRDGQALDSFRSGRYTLETQQLPILEKLNPLPVDSEKAFHSEVYFFNLANQMALKWGTPEKVRLIDPLTDAPISVGARGILNFRISNARKLLLKLVGTTAGLKRQDILGDGTSEAKNYFRSIIQTTVSTHLADAIRAQNIDILQIDQCRPVLSANLLTQLRPAFDEYGLEIVNFVVEGIVLPERGDLGYDALQTIIKMRQSTLSKAAIETETSVRMAEMEAKKKLDIRTQENLAEVEAARRGTVQARGQTSVLEAQLEGQKKVAEASAEVEAERLRLQLEMQRKAQVAQIEAEEMRLKGYNQKDVLQADVMKAFAENSGSGAGMGTMSGIAGDAMQLGMGFAAMGATVGMAKDVIGTGVQSTAGMFGNVMNPAPTAAGWDCACGTKNITSNFCPNCGSKKPEPRPADTWDCSCGTKGITFNFCPNCGAKRPAAPAGWDCACGTKGITFNFCPNCGAKRPAPRPATWDCTCGTKDITFNFCPNCGKKRED